MARVLVEVVRTRSTSEVHFVWREVPVEATDGTPPEAAPLDA